jgi:pre-60S factor REI1
MTKFHALFIPEQVYLVDLEGLISYLQAKVTENHECLFCHKLKGSTSGVQTHMRDKGHCMIAFDSEEEMIEIGQFYDFRSTYSDEDEDDSDATMSDAGPRSAGAKLGARRSSKDVEMEDGNDGWETDSSASSLDSSELHAVPIDHDHAYDRLASHRHHTHSDPRAHRAPDGFHSHAHSHHAAFHSDHELHLPSGRTAGHRSLARYYRQNLHSYPTPEERVQQRMITAEAANGAEDAGSNGNLQVATRTEGGLLGVTEQKRREVATITKRQQKRAQRDRSRFQWGKEKGANSQKHFRDDNFGIYRS